MSEKEQSGVPKLENVDTIGTENIFPNSPPKPTDPLVKKLPKAKIKFPAGLKLRTFENSVAKHIAKVYVNKAGADMVATLQWIKPGFEEKDYYAYAKHIHAQEKIQEAIEAEYRAIGIDEDAKQRYIGQLWRNLTEGNDKTKQVVLGLLGRALGIGEMADETRIPVELPIKGIEEGWKRMEGKEAVAAQNPTGFSKLEKEEELPDD